MKNKSTDPEFPILGNDEHEYPAGVLAMKHGLYGFVEFDMYSENSDDLRVGGSQQVGFVMSRDAALRLAAAIREHYGIKDTDDDSQVTS